MRDKSRLKHVIVQLFNSNIIRKESKYHECLTI